MGHMEEFSLTNVQEKSEKRKIINGKENVLCAADRKRKKSFVGRQNALICTFFWTIEVKISFICPKGMKDMQGTCSCFHDFVKKIKKMLTIAETMCKIAFVVTEE